MNYKVASALLFTSILSACEVPVLIAASQNDAQMTGPFELTFPAAMFAVYDGDTEELLVGEMIGKASGKATFTVEGPTWGVCEGQASTRTGDISVTCDNGLTIDQNLGPQRMKMSGLNTFAGQQDGVEFVTFFGWGNFANEADLRAAYADYSSAL